MRGLLLEPQAGTSLLYQLRPPRTATKCTPLSSVLILKVLGLNSHCLRVAGDGRQGWASSGTHVPFAFGRFLISHMTGSFCIKNIHSAT